MNERLHLTHVVFPDAQTTASTVWPPELPCHRSVSGRLLSYLSSVVALWIFSPSVTCFTLSSGNNHTVCLLGLALRELKHTIVSDT